MEVKAKLLTPGNWYIRELASWFQTEQAKQREAFIRQELKRLKTFRLNVALEVESMAFSREGVEQNIRLRMLLPRGARPLPS